MIIQKLDMLLCDPVGFTLVCASRNERVVSLSHPATQLSIALSDKAADVGVTVGERLAHQETGRA